MALSFGIGAVRKKTTARGAKKATTASKTKKVVAKKVVAKKKAGASPTAGSKVSASGKRYYPSTPKSKKSYSATTTCSNAGKKLKATGNPRAGAVLALCKASVQNLKVTEKALKKHRVQLAKLSKK